jgi:hypothetical protein
MGILDPLIGAGLSALLQRTYMLQSSGSSFFSIPFPLAVFDAILEEEPEYTADVTQHPVESGPEVSDHIQLKNPTLRLKGTISNSPLDLAVSVGNAVAGGLGAITSSQTRSNLLNTGLSQAAGTYGAALLGGASASSATGSFLGGAADALARSVLLNAFQNKQIVDIVTKRQKYESMVIQSLSFPRDSNTGYQVVFEMSLIHIRIVSPLETLLSSVAENVITSASGTTNLGSQAGAGVTGQTASSAGNNSILRSLLGQ